MKYVLHYQARKEENFLTSGQKKNQISQTGQEYQLIENIPWLEWFVNNYKKYSATLKIGTDKS